MEIAFRKSYLPMVFLFELDLHGAGRELDSLGFGVILSEGGCWLLGTNVTFYV